MFKLKLFKRTVASAVAGALTITAPGLPCYQALAQVTLSANSGAGMPGVQPGASAATGQQRPAAGAVRPVVLDRLIGADSLISGAGRPAARPAVRIAVSDPVARIVLRSSRAIPGLPVRNGALPFQAPSARRSVHPLVNSSDRLHRSILPDADLLEHPEVVALTPEQVYGSSSESAKNAGDRAADRVLGVRGIEARQSFASASQPPGNKDKHEGDASLETLPRTADPDAVPGALPAEAPITPSDRMQTRPAPPLPSYPGREFDWRYPHAVAIPGRSGGSLHFQIAFRYRPTGFVRPGVDLQPAGGFWNRIWDWIRVIPENSRSRGYWLFILAEAVSNFSDGFLAMFLPGLGSLPSSGHFGGWRQGLSEGLYTGGEGVSSIVSGKMIDQSSIKKILIRNPLGIALAFAINCALLWTGHFELLWVSIPFFAVQFAAGFLGNRVTTGGDVGFNRFFADGYEHLFTKGEAVYVGITKTFKMLGVVTALWFFMMMVGLTTSAAVPFVGMLLHGSNSGFALAFLGSGILALIMAGVYSLINFPRTNILKARDALTANLKNNPELGPRVKGIFTEGEETEISKGRKSQRTVFIVEMTGNLDDVPRTENPDDTKAVPWYVRVKDRYGKEKIIPVQIIRPRTLRQNLMHGAEKTWKDSFLRIMTLLSVLGYFLLGAAGTMSSAYASRVLIHGGISAHHFFASLPILNLFLGLMNSPVKDAFNFGAYGLYLLAVICGSMLSAAIIALWPNKALSEFDSALSRFQSALENVEFPQEFPKDQTIDAVVDAADRAEDEVLKSYRDARNPNFKETPDGFHSKLIAQIIKSINEDVFDGRVPPEETASLIQKTGLEEDLAKWSKRHFDVLMKGVRREIKTGLDAAKRSVRRSIFLGGLGILALLGAYQWTSPWLWLAWTFASSFLLGPGLVILEGSFTNNWILQKYTGSMGRIYNFRQLCILVAETLGAILFGILTDIMPITGWLGIFNVIVILIACVFFRATFKNSLFKEGNVVAKQK